MKINFKKPSHCMQDGRSSYVRPLNHVFYSFTHQDQHSSKVTRDEMKTGLKMPRKSTQVLCHLLQVFGPERRDHF